MTGYIASPAGLNFDAQINSYTIGYWAKDHISNANGAGSRIVEYYDGTPNRYPFSIQTGSTNANIVCYDGTNTRSNNTSGLIALTDAPYFHLAVFDHVKDLSIGYFNGREFTRNSNTMGLTTATSNLWFGNNSSFTRPLTHTVWGIVIWFRALSAKDVLYLYEDWWAQYVPSNAQRAIFLPGAIGER